jgi:hypothetical protein
MVKRDDNKSIAEIEPVTGLHEQKLTKMMTTHVNDNIL